MARHDAPGHPTASRAIVTAFLTWLPDVLKDAGVDVYVMPW